MPGYADMMDIVNGASPIDAPVSDNAPQPANNDLNDKMEMLRLGSQGKYVSPYPDKIESGSDNGLLATIGNSGFGQQVDSGIKNASDVMGNVYGMVSGQPYKEQVPTPDMNTLKQKGWGKTSGPERTGAILESLLTSPTGKMAGVLSATPQGAAVGSAIGSGNDYMEKNWRLPHQYAQAAELPLIALFGKGASDSAAAGLEKLNTMSTNPAPRAGFFESASSDPMAPSTKPIPVKPQVAELVKDAVSLGIDVPSHVFNPTTESSVLDKIGMMKTNDMKNQTMTAISKIMGHPGTPNLDTGVMGGIYKHITGKMNDFALKADDVGGIPLDESFLQSVVDNSNSPTQAQGLMNNIKRRLTNGALSGADYKELTQHEGALSRGMRSSTSDFADTASDFREYLDSQLQKTVNPDDLAAFLEAKKQYRTMKIIRPLVEEGGITGQADSASKLFRAVVKNYGSIENALQFNPELGKIAQIVNEFPDTLSEARKISRINKLKATLGGNAALTGLTAWLGGTPAIAASTAIAPIAYGRGRYLSSSAYKNKVLNKSLSPDFVPLADKLANDRFWEQYERDNQ